MSHNQILKMKSLKKKEFSMKHLLSVINVDLYLLPKKVQSALF